MNVSSKALIFLGLAALGCGGSDGAERERPLGDDEGASPDDDADAPGRGEGASVPTPDYGFVCIEPIEDDGGETALGVSPVLVERLDELRDALALLEQAKLSLSIMIQAHKLADDGAMDALFSVIEDATARGIQVRPIPVLSADDGYYPNATNHEPFAAATRELVRQWKARGLPDTTLMVDMEPPRDLMAALSSLDLAKALPLEHIDRARYAEGVEAYRALVDELHGEGFRVAMTTQATLLADYRDDDDDLRQYFNVVIEGPAWDEIEIQLYRSAFGMQAPGLDAHFVHDFVRAAQARFADKTLSFALGVTHPGPVYPDTATIGTASELRKDVAAALAAGVSREHLSVYNLKGILLGPPKCEMLLGCEASDYEYGENDPLDWLKPAESREPPAESPATAVLWTQLDLMDGLLNVSPAANAQR